MKNDISSHGYTEAKGPATLAEATGSAQCKMCGASFSPIWLKELQKMSTVCPACVIEALEKMVNLKIWPNGLLKHMLPNTKLSDRREKNQ